MLYWFAECPLCGCLIDWVVAFALQRWKIKRIGVSRLMVDQRAAELSFIPSHSFEIRLRNKHRLDKVEQSRGA